MRLMCFVSDSLKTPGVCSGNSEKVGLATFFIGHPQSFVSLPTFAHHLILLEKSVDVIGLQVDESPGRPLLELSFSANGASPSQPGATPQDPDRNLIRAESPTHYFANPEINPSYLRLASN